MVEAEPRIRAQQLPSLSSLKRVQLNHRTVANRPSLRLIVNSDDHREDGVHREQEATRQAPCARPAQNRQSQRGSRTERQRAERIARAQAQWPEPQRRLGTGHRREGQRGRRHRQEQKRHREDLPSG